MHNVISSCFFPSEELCWAEGGGGGGEEKGQVIYRWQWGIVVGAERLFCFCFFFSLSVSLSLSLFLTFS